MSKEFCLCSSPVYELNVSDVLDKHQFIAGKGGPTWSGIVTLYIGNIQLVKDKKDCI